MPKKIYSPGQPRRLPGDDIKIHVLQQARPSTFASLVNSIIAGRIQYLPTISSPEFKISDGIVT